MRRVFRAAVQPLGDDEVEAIISTGDVARDGHILVPQGCDLTGFRANPIILWAHDPNQPVGRAEQVMVGGNKIAAKIRFAPAGISPVADTVRGLVKSGVITTMSIGFDVEDGEPLDPAKPRGGQRFTKWTLLEASFVSVPADTGAVVTARALETSGRRGSLAGDHSARLRLANAHHRTAITEIGRSQNSHSATSAAITRLEEHRARVAAAFKATRQALQEDDTEAALAAHRELQRHMAAMDKELTALSATHGEMGDAQRAARRAVDKAAEHVRAVIDASGEVEETPANNQVQTSGGISDDGGATAPRSLADGSPTWKGDSIRFAHEMRVWLESRR